MLCKLGSKSSLVAERGVEAHDESMRWEWDGVTLGEVDGKAVRAEVQEREEAKDIISEATRIDQTGNMVYAIVCLTPYHLVQCHNHIGRNGYRYACPRKAFNDSNSLLVPNKMKRRNRCGDRPCFSLILSPLRFHDTQVYPIISLHVSLRI